MRRVIMFFAAAFCLVVMMNATALAQAFMVENFSYSTGQLTSASGGADVSGGNWANISGASAFVQVSSGSLSYAGYPESGVGNKIDISVTGVEDVARTFASQTSGTVYASFLVNVANTTGLATNASTTGDYFTGLLNAGGTQDARVSIRIGSVAGTYQLGLRASSTNATTTFFLTDFSPGTTHLIVISYQIVAGTNNDITNLWINPPIGGSEPAADVTQTTAGNELADINRFFVRQTADTPNGSIDGIKVGTSWSAVTLVRLQSFDATSSSNGTLLQWQTGYEVNNLGFNLYREEKGKRTRVNPSIIAGSALLAGPGTGMTAGDSYLWIDPQGTSDSVYYLEDIDLNGTRKLEGPFIPSVSPSRINTGRRRSAMLTEIGPQGEELNAVSIWQKGWPAYTGTGRQLLYDIDEKPGTDLQSLIAAHGAVKLSVNKEGWYRVTQADLVAAGFNQNIDSRTLQLYVGGVQVPIRMNASKQQFSPGDSFEFYGTGLDTPTTDTNTYWVVIGNTKGSRISPAIRTLTSVQTDTSISQPQNGAGQGVQALPSTASPQVNRSWWYIVPMIIRSAPKEDVDKPTELKGDTNDVKEEAAPNLAPSNNDSERAATPAKKSRKTKARAKKSRLKASSRHHAMLRPAAVESYAYTVELKEKLIYASGILNRDAENFFGQPISSAPVNQGLYLSSLSQNSGGSSRLEVALQGLTNVSHQVKVKLNGQEVGALSFAGQAHKSVELSVPSSLLVEGQNSVTLERSSGDAADVTLVYYIRLTYEHRFRADDNVLRFTAEGSTRLDGFGYNNVRVVDVSDPLRVRELNSTVESTSQGFAVTIHAPREGEYLAFTDEQTLRPARIELDAPSNLRSNNNGADLVIISYGDFVSNVQPLATQRRTEGLAVSVVDVQDVYDEFSGGAHSPYAIKDFLSWAKTRWLKSPQYVLLVGDAGVDPRNYQGNGFADFVPTKLIDALTMETASDDWLADFNNDGVAEMAVGRLPVRTKTEADQVVSKITGYTPTSTLQQVLMVVDRNNASDGFSFAQSGAELGALLPSSVSMNTINRANSSDDAALHSQIVGAINQGPLMVNYIGHGSIEVWTGASILSTSDTAALNNSNHLPVFVMMTCLNGYFPNPARDSLAEALLRNNSSGAVAVWASSGMTQPHAQSQMNKELYRQVFGQNGVRLGEAVLKAKESTDDMDVRRTWNLFGDPTMKLH